MVFEPEVGERMSVMPKPHERKSLRIGYMLRMYPRFSQTFVVNEILELERQDVDVKILSLRKPTDGRFHESLSRVCATADYLPEHIGQAPRKILKVHLDALGVMPSRYWRSLLAMLRHTGADWIDFWQAALVLRWARKNKLDHVHVHFGAHEASVAYLAYLMGGLSYSLTLHAFDIFRSTVDRKLLTRKINGSRFTVTVSQYNRNHLLESLDGVDPNKIRVNYNGIDLERFRGDGSFRQPHSILSVGRLIEKKGFIHLIRAVAQLRSRGVPAVCRIIGEGREERRLREAIRQLGLKNTVELAGPLPQRQVRKLLAESACFVLPCVYAADGNVDALPTVLLEAMACECPCVSTTVSGVPEIIEHGYSGLLVPPNDDDALADAMAQILEDSQLSARLARNGRQKAESCFDVRQAVGQMRTWFSEAVTPTAAGQPRGDAAMKLPAA